MTTTEPRFTVETNTVGRYAVVDNRSGRTTNILNTEDEAQVWADTRNRLDALGIKPGDTVTGWYTYAAGASDPVRVTVDREPQLGSLRTAVLSDGRTSVHIDLGSITVQPKS